MFILCWFLFDYCETCFHVQWFGEKCLITIRRPASEGELATLVDEDFFADFLHIIPPIRTIDSEKFAIDIIADGMGDWNVFG